MQNTERQPLLQKNGKKNIDITIHTTVSNVELYLLLFIFQFVLKHVRYMKLRAVKIAVFI